MFNNLCIFVVFCNQIIDCIDYKKHNNPFSLKIKSSIIILIDTEIEIEIEMIYTYGHTYATSLKLIK